MAFEAFSFRVDLGDLNLNRVQPPEMAVALE
jgi:hypothetical protein